jgi:hypothetical protein
MIRTLMIMIRESITQGVTDDDDDESTEYDPNEMALFIRRFSKMMSKQKFSKETRKIS